MKRVLVTGAAGFVGSNLARRLLKEGHEVSLLLREGSQSWRIEDMLSHLRVFRADLCDPEGIHKAVAEIKPEWIFHLASYGAYSWQQDFVKMMQTNFYGTANLLNACLHIGFDVFVNTGSSSEYGFKDGPAQETEILEPNSPYAITKAAATHFCQYAAKRQQAHVPTLRLYSVFGPYEDPGRLIPALIVQGIQQRYPPLVQSNVARDFVYTADVEDAYLMAAMQKGQEKGAIYNVGTGIQTNLQDVVKVARQLMEIAPEPQWGNMPNRSWDTASWIADIVKIKAQLGWQPRYSFERGFSETISWYKQNSQFWSRYQNA